MSPLAFPPSRVLIIGGGPAGLVSYRNLLQYGKFEKVTLYERRDDVGGVWYLDNPPPTNPFTPPPSSPRWPSPAYPGLIGNVLPEYLSFTNFSFPERSDPHQPFPTLTETHEFLRSFAEPFIKQGGIELSIEVIRVEELQEGWKVTVRDWNIGGEERVEKWNAVVVAVGWYDHPVWPDIAGLEELKDKGIAKHAKWYRGPQGSEGKRALIIGNANSGNDIAAHLAPVALTPVYQSIRRPAFPGFVSLRDERINNVAPVSRFELSYNHKVTVHLEDRTILHDIDIIHIATGYKPYPDFIHVFFPNTENKLMRLVDQHPYPDTGPRIPSLHQHILYAYNPTLSFIGSPMSFTPFTINDISSLWLSQIWSLTLPLLSSALTSSPSYLLQFEKDRMEVVENMRKEYGDNPSALFVYGVLGRSEEEYANGLKVNVLSVLGDEGIRIAGDWEPEDERRKLREKMYARKLEALKWAVASDHLGKAV